MNLDWQTVAVLVLLAAACAYLTRLAWQSVTRRQAASCGGCDTCPSSAAEGDEPAVVTLGALREPSDANFNGQDRD